MSKENRKYLHSRCLNQRVGAFIHSLDQPINNQSINQSIVPGYILTIHPVLRTQSPPPSPLCPTSIKSKKRSGQVSVIKKLLVFGPRQFPRSSVLQTPYVCLQHVEPQWHVSVNALGQWGVGLRPGSTGLTCISSLQPSAASPLFGMLCGTERWGQSVSARWHLPEIVQGYSLI